MPLDTITSLPETKITRRSFLKAGAWLAGAGALGLAGVSLYEPHELSVVSLEVRLPRLPAVFDGLRLTQISDIHFGDYLAEDRLRKIVQQANQVSPDLVVITGDFVTAPFLRSHKTRAAELTWRSAPVLQGLRGRHGVLAVLGNHDHLTNPQVISEALHAHGIRVLRNQSHAIEVDNARLWLAGIDDVSQGRARVDITLRGIPLGETVVAAVHEPDYADVVRLHDVDLQLSGHSHGGQVRLPFIGAPYLPPLAKKYPWGYRRLGRLQLYTNRGIGVIHVPVRFMCPPELTVFTLRRAA